MVAGTMVPQDATVTKTWKGQRPENLNFSGFLLGRGS